MHEEAIHARLDTMNNHIMIIVLGVCLAISGAAKGDGSIDFQQLMTGAEKGDVVAQYQLGLQYRAGTRVEKNYALALNWLTKAARQGHVDAQHRVAICYNNGEGTLPDRVKAYAWYLVASMNGHKHARAKQKVYKSILNKRQLHEGQKLARSIHAGIRDIP